MSNLATAIVTLIKEKNTTAAAIASKSGINAASMSRLINGVQTSIKPQVLADLARAFSASPEVHAQLLCAHLKDKCSGSGANYISIKLLSNPSPDAKRQLHLVLPPSIQQDLNDITKCVNKNHFVRDIIKILARECRERKE